MALIAHYKLNGDAHDSIGQNHGSVWGSVLFEQGVIGDAFSTEDATGRIDTGMPPSRFINDFSISCWVRVKQWGLSVGVFGNRVSPNGFMFYRNTGDSDNLLRIYMHYEREGDSNTAVSNTWNQFPTNEWFHVVFRRRKDSYDLWFNGQRVIARNSMPSTFTRWAESGNINLRIGAGGSGWTTRNMDIDDFRVFDHNLSEKEIQQLYKPDVVPDLRNVELDGEQGPDFLELADYPFIPGSNTLSMWVYPTTTDMRQTLWNNGYGGEGTINFETNGRLRIYVGPAGGNQAGYTSLDSTILPLNEWTHATAVITNSQLRWYINGSLAATRGISFDRGETSFLPRLGTGYTNYFRGRIKGFSSFAGELSDEGILSLYRTKASLDSEGNLHSVGLFSSTLLDVQQTPNGSSHNGTYGLRFTVDKDTIIHSAVVRPYFSGSTVVQLFNHATQSLEDSISIDVINGEEQRVELGLRCRPGIDYWLTVSEGNFMRTNAGVQFPYSEGPFTFTISSSSSSATADRWYYFFNIEYSENNSLKEEGYALGGLSEKGTTQSLAHWWPFVGTVEDLAGRIDTPDGIYNLEYEGVVLGGEPDFLEYPLNIGQTYDRFSVSFWGRKAHGLPTGYPVLQFHSTGNSWGITWGSTSLAIFNDTAGISNQTHFLTSVPDDEWVFVVLTYNPENGFGLHVDGEDKGTIISGEGPPSTPSSRFLIGKRGNNTTYFQGTIRDLRVHNEVLSTQTINTLMNITKLGGSTNMSFSSRMGFVRNEFKEV